ncbi:MAG: DUF4149 domain-containing protein [Pseudomonadota bacterium]
MQDIIATLAIVTSGTLFGAMVFFPSVVAPNVFRVLDEDTGGAFLRRLFPAYYVFIIVLSGLTAVFAMSHPFLAIGFAVVAISTLLVRQLLLPRLNAWRDQGKAGDAAAQKKFDGGHRFSVIVNLAQMLFVVIALWLLAS